MSIPTLAFATSYWDGENLQSATRPPSALDLLSLAAYQAEFMGRNWGVPAEFLLYNPTAIRHYEGLSLSLLHDVPLRPTTDADLLESARLWKAFDLFGRHEAQWLPYWANGSYVAASPEGIKVSIYNRPGRGFIAVIVNAGRTPAAASVKFNLAALGQSTNLLARDVLRGVPVAITAGGLSEQLGLLENAVVWLTPK
jgi:hypothetical protein